MTMTPRPLITAVLALAVLGVVATTASAQDKETARVAGTYKATFDQVANSCSGVGMNLSSATVEVTQSGRRVTVTIPSVPIMKGTATKAGKFRATVKRGKTAIEGVDGRFSVAGRVEKGEIQFLFIAEYFRGKRPLCTQSWNATGK
ncbi:MAG TPA: hypothetical protein VKZ63_01530 [Kofleriaceae bacterium]|nr:hypothetical protein [Kofleriaceae bacterium]